MKRLLTKVSAILTDRGVRALFKQAEVHATYSLMQQLPCNSWGDKLFALGLFYISHGRLPRKQWVFNDFMHHIKTSGELRDPLRVFVSDKEFVKMYVKARVGDIYNVPTIKVLRSPGEVDEYRFPPNCCIKPTHASGQVLIVRNGARVDVDAIKTWFRQNYYIGTREQNYKTLLPKVIVEPLIFDQSEPTDYKLFCMHGAVKFVQADVQRQSDHKRLIVDRQWNVLPFSIQYPQAQSVPEKPGNWDDMIRIAEVLSDQFEFIRVDMYSDGETCLVGELTNCQGNAGEKFLPSSGEALASSLLFDGDSPVYFSDNADHSRRSHYLQDRLRCRDHDE